jgi:hypothetical protein
MFPINLIYLNNELPLYNNRYNNLHLWYIVIYLNESLIKQVQIQINKSPLYMDHHEEKQYSMPILSFEMEIKSFNSFLQIILNMQTSLQAKHHETCHYYLIYNYLKISFPLYKYTITIDIRMKKSFTLQISTNWWHFIYKLYLIQILPSK